MINFKKLRTERRKKDLTQENIAEHIGVAPSTYARWERGEIFPPMETLNQLAQYLEVDVSELLENSDKNVALSVTGNSDFYNPQTQAGLNFYHNNYYGNKVLTAEIDKLKQAQEQMQIYYETLVAQLKDENTFLKEMLTALQKSEKHQVV